MSYDGMKVRQIKGGRSTLVEPDADVGRYDDEVDPDAPASTAEIIAEYERLVGSPAKLFGVLREMGQALPDYKAVDKLIAAHGFKRVVCALNDKSTKASSLFRGYGSKWGAR